jgi:hypothetical protein
MQPHFGLGQHARVDRVEVRWMDGSSNVLRDVEADQVVLITQGAQDP